MSNLMYFYLNIFKLFFKWIFLKSKIKSALEIHKPIFLNPNLSLNSQDLFKLGRDKTKKSSNFL